MKETEEILERSKSQDKFENGLKFEYTPQSTLRHIVRAWKALLALGV